MSANDPRRSWSETDSATFLAIADVAVPRRQAMIETLAAFVPFETKDAIKILDLGSGDGRLASALLTAFPQATLTALDGSQTMRAEAVKQLKPFGDRARVAAFDVTSLDWWDRMFGVDLIVSSLCLHHLGDAKTQYLYKAAAERLSDRGAIAIADLVNPQSSSAAALAADRWDALAREQAATLGAPELFERFVESRWNHFRFPDASDRPAALFHHFVWLRHAGFAGVDCVWFEAGHAVFGGVKKGGALGEK